MHEKGNTNIEKYLFYLMLIFSCLAYVGYFVYAKRNGITISVSYSRSNSSMMQANNLFVMIFRFGKDVFAALLLLTEMLSMNRSYRAKVFMGMLLVVAYGTIVALANNMTMNTIVSGYRMVVYFSSLVMYFNSTKFSRISLKKFLNVLTILLIVNTVIAIIQAYDKLGLKFTLIGHGSYRFMGLFPAAAAFAYFCLGTALFAYCIDNQSDIYHKHCILLCIIAFIGCYISGTRSSIINLLIIIFVYVINKSKMKKAQKILVSSILAIPVVIYIIRFSTNLANRGSILENAVSGGRFTIFINSIFKQSFVNIIFGNGIGAGSNSAAEFMNRSGSSDLLFLDGTFTVFIYQFGIIGFLMCLVFIIAIIKAIYTREGLLNSVLFGGTIILQCLTTNVLEAFALLIMLFTCYYTLINGSELFSEFEVAEPIPEVETESATE